MSDDDFVTPIEVHCEGRRLHLRRDQLTVANLSKLSNIAPDTIYLISDDDFVALPDNEGRFPSLQAFRTWRTEGVVQTTNNSSKSEGKSEYYGQERFGYGRIKWKPKIFPPRKQALPLLAHTNPEPVIHQVHKMGKGIRDA